MSGDRVLLEQAARAAGAVALRYWRQAPEVWEKADGAGPVSEADLAVDARLAADLRGARPDYGWLSEESAAPGRLAAGRCFIVDPIDGTRAFLDGTPDFALSLAVAEAGRVTAAAVFLPAQDRLYSASADGPALLNGAPIRCSGRDRLDGATLLSARSTLMPEHWRAVPPVRRMFRSSLAWRLCLVAEGAFDAMLTLRPSWEWDIAAGGLIAERAGARVTDRLGAALRFNREDPRTAGCLAAAPQVHAGLLAALCR
ncbi:MAG: 3'(2'),5'-bisphosphate nucleotidase CysQ [Proteobacteria bacterium]|nr:3'(2'),5'-bisphosphate nucleotidase CysQ [Pseudomonadota bacterium]MBS0572135.1 3'(2'),5'-bisphosphate nucleotidase CysQ [Pseudomonadota bacterium]